MDDVRTPEQLLSEAGGSSFRANFHKLQTLTDGGLRLSLDLSLSELQKVIGLPSMAGQVLQVVIVPEPSQDEAGGPW
jgi:hypothetical protein